MLLLLLFSFFFLVSSTVASVDPMTVWPKPQMQTIGGRLLLQPVTFDFRATRETSDILREAFKRYHAIIFNSMDFQYHQLVREGEADVLGLDVSVTDPDLALTLDTDESYELQIHRGRAELTARTVYGALRGLESFSQLTKYGIYTLETTIKDFPRFKYRGSMIDTCRHFYPIEVILMHLDAMAYNKMNVLHWHIVDSQSYPFESRKFPSLHQTGAYTPGHVYTPDDVQRVIAYARNRGILVIPEFDSPGHVEAGYKSIPDLLTDCQDGTTGPFNPTLPSTYAFVKELFQEVREVFADSPYVHVGGDEVRKECWMKNDQITRWMKENNMEGDYLGLERYYHENLFRILEEKNFPSIVWEEVFTNSASVLPKTSVVEVWKERNWEGTIADVTRAGFQSILSSPFYLNYISYGLDWPTYYETEPTNFEGNKEQKDLVIGIETCMWSEFVDATNFISRTWPRSSAVAERAWSAENVRDLEDAQARLQEFRCKLLRRGLNAQPASNGAFPGTGAGFCDQEHTPVYRPPWGASL